MGINAPEGYSDRIKPVFPLKHFLDISVQKRLKIDLGYLPDQLNHLLGKFSESVNVRHLRVFGYTTPGR